MVEHPLAQRLLRQHLLRQQRDALRHPPRAAARAEAAALAAEHNEFLGETVFAAYAQKGVLQTPALQIRLELVLHVLRQQPARTVSSGIGFATRAELSGYVTRAGFVVDEIASYARGYSTPHVLFVAHAVAHAA